MLTRGDIDVIEQAPGIAKDAHGRPIVSAQLVVVANVPKKSDPKTDANVAIGFHGLPVVVSMLPGTMLLALLGGVIGAVIVWLAFNGYTASTLGGNFSQVVFQFRVTPELLWTGIVGAGDRFHRRPVPCLRAALDSIGDFKSSLIYQDGVAPGDFVSLTMQVRREPWIWDDVLHPVFQMNLPGGYLLQVLQEQFGPHIGASPMALLSVIGRNMIGRFQVAPAEVKLDEPAKPVDVAALLQGDNSEEAFAELVRQHATSGVSGVVPKFLDVDVEKAQLGRHKKASILTRRHIIKGSSRLMPFVSLNEHLCMNVARKVMPAAQTEVSLDGQALVVRRFDVGDNGEPHWGMEDFCALLGLRPAAKYETTWERIARAVRDHVPADRRPEVFRQMATLLLLSYALRNADFHAKNIALLYTGRADVRLAPAYDMITTITYPDYANNPPAISFLGRKAWDPGKTLKNFITATFGLPPREQARIVEQIGEAVAETGPQVREAMKEHPQFGEIGKRMLLAWHDGLAGLRSKRTYAMGDIELGKAFTGFSDPEPARRKRKVAGRSELLGKR